MATVPEMKPMELEGSLKAFKLPETLRFLAAGGLTGVLSLDRAGRQVELNFQDGKVVGASSSDRPVRLGQMLIYAGRLTHHALEEALAVQEQGQPDKKFLGEILLERKLVSQDDLSQVIRLQIEEEIWELFSWDSGNFRFEQCAVRTSDPMEVSLEVPPLLEEGSRRMEEWQVICENIDDPRMVFCVNPDFSGPLEVPLDPHTWQVLALLNGKLPVEAIVRLSNLGKFETYWAIHTLIRAELIEQASSTSVDGENGAGGSGAGESAPASETEPDRGAADSKAAPKAGRRNKSRIRGFFGRNKEQAEETARQNGDSPWEEAGEALAQGKPDNQHTTDVGLVCSMINLVIDAFNAHAKFRAAASAGELTRMWDSAEQHYPKASLIRMEEGRLNAELFDRYVKAAGALVPSLAGAHGHSLEALHAFWKEMKAEAEKRLDKSMTDAAIDNAVRKSTGQSAPLRSPDFSLERWMDGTP